MRIFGAVDILKLALTRLFKLAFYLALLAALFYQYWPYWPFGFEFRGYDVTSSCDVVIGAEQTLGGKIVSRRQLDLGFGDGEVDVTRLDIELFGQPTSVDVACRDDASVHGILYDVTTTDLDRQWEVYELISSALEDDFGPAGEYVGRAHRTRNFFCSHRGGLTLTGGGYDLDGTEGRVSILVSLHRDPCL